jgi:hypothetical protein
MTSKGGVVMADKEVHVVDSGAGAGMLLVALL